MSHRVQAPMPAEHRALNDAIRRAAGHAPAEQPRDKQVRDEQARFVAGGLEGGNGRGAGALLSGGQADTSAAMNREIRRAAGKYVGPGRRAKNGLCLEQ